VTLEDIPDRLPHRASWQAMILHKLQTTARKLLWQPGRVQRLFGSLKNIWKNLTLTRVAFAVVIVPTLFYLYDETTHHVLIIDSINLPQDTSKNGFTSAVMVNQVGDALRRMEAATRTQMNKDSVRLPQEAVSPPSIEVPGAKFGINDLVAILRSIFRIYPQRITGDVVFPQAQLAPIPTLENYVCDNASSLAGGPVAIATVYATSARHLGTSSVRFVVPRDDLDGLVQCTAEVVLMEVNPYILALYKEQQGKYEASLRIIEKMLEEPALKDGVKIAAYILQGIVRSDQKNYTQAEDSFQKAIEIDQERRRWYSHPAPPHAADAYNNWGNMLEDRKQYNKAIEKYQMAIELDPKDAMAYENWGISIDDQNLDGDATKYQAAIEKLQTAIKLEPKSAFAYLNLAVIIAKQNSYQHNEVGQYRAAKEYQAAIKTFQKSIELDPRIAHAHKNLGDVYLTGQEYGQADTEFRKATELEPKYADAFSGWGTVFLAQQNYPEAIGKYRKAIELDPENEEAYNNWGAALEEWDKSDRDAIARNQEKLNHNRNDAAARTALAATHDQQTKRREAQKEFDKIPAPAPDQE
jgi:tetratricopeptide (TPR) repeat protein